MPDSIDLARYSVFVPPDPFEDHIGPFYFRIHGDAPQGRQRALRAADRAAPRQLCRRRAWRRHPDLRRLRALPGGRPRRRRRHQHLLRHDGEHRRRVPRARGRIGPPLEATRRAAAGHGAPRLRARHASPSRARRSRCGRACAATSRAPRRWRARTRPRRRARDAPPQTVPTGFELFAKASVYSRHIGPSYARKEVDGASLVQPTLPHMCNSGGVLHGGYMMSFADSAMTRAAGARHRHGADDGVLRRRVPGGRRSSTAPLVTRVEVPRHGKSTRLPARPARAERPAAALLFGDDDAAAAASA